MKAITSTTWSTPLIIACSAVVAVSGTMMFFDWEKSSVKLMHEWLGILFVIAIVLHASSHWLPFAGYFSKRRSLLVFLVILSLAGIGVSIGIKSGERNQGNPLLPLAGLVQKAPLSAVAALMRENSEEVVALLQDHNIQTDSVEQNLAEIAMKNKRSSGELLKLLLEEYTGD